VISAYKTRPTVLPAAGVPALGVGGDTSTNGGANNSDGGVALISTRSEEAGLKPEFGTVAGNSGWYHLPGGTQVAWFRCNVATGEWVLEHGTLPKENVEQLLQPLQKLDAPGREEICTASWGVAVANVTPAQLSQKYQAVRGKGVVASRMYMLLRSNLYAGHRITAVPIFVFEPWDLPTSRLHDHVPPWLPRPENDGGGNWVHHRRRRSSKHFDHRHRMSQNHGPASRSQGPPTRHLGIGGKVRRASAVPRIRHGAVPRIFVWGVSWGPLR
jgi:hypothetical protein